MSGKALAAGLYGQSRPTRNRWLAPFRSLISRTILTSCRGPDNSDFVLVFGEEERDAVHYSAISRGMATNRIRPTPRFSTWTTIPPGATRKVPGIKTCHAKPSIASINPPVPFALFFSVRCQENSTFSREKLTTTASCARVTRSQVE